MDGALLTAFLVTLGAGLATGIGSTIAFFTHHTNRVFFAVSMGFSAGVMIYLSFVEILPKATKYLAADMGQDPAAAAPSGLAALFFVAGLILMAIIDNLVPSSTNPHENTDVELIGEDRSPSQNKKMLRMGLFMALAIAIHNLPEGLATFMLVLDDPKVGIALAVAVAMHNIPEGIAVSVPIYHATGSRLKAFRLSFLSGLAEPIGAVVGYMVLSQFLSDYLLGAIFAMVGGVMVFLSIDTILPTARNSARGHLTVYGLITGMAVMAASLYLLKI